MTSKLIWEEKQVLVLVLQLSIPRLDSTLKSLVLQQGNTVAVLWKVLRALVYDQRQPEVHLNPQIHHGPLHSLPQVKHLLHLPFH